VKTIDEQIKSVQREIGMRQRVYPAWVKKGLMTQDQAAHEIACMEEVHRTLVQVRREQESVGKPTTSIEEIRRIMNDIGTWDTQGEALRDAVEHVFGAGTWEKLLR